MSHWLRVDSHTQPHGLVAVRADPLGMLQMLEKITVTMRLSPQLRSAKAAGHHLLSDPAGTCLPGGEADVVSPLREL